MPKAALRNVAARNTEGKSAQNYQPDLYRSLASQDLSGKSVYLTNNRWKFMIISHEHRFVFMHNPKVAGSSVRSALGTFRDTPFDLIGPDPSPASSTHLIDRAHLGIHEFSEHYPDLWDRTQNYTFFALRRDPVPRFFSSLSEYSRAYGERDIRFAEPNARRDFLLKTIDVLSGLGAAEAVMSHLKFTHFRPQWIYFAAPKTSSGGQLDVRAYDLSEMSQFAADLSEVTSDQISFPRENSSEAFKLPRPIGAILSSNRLRRSLSQVPGSLEAMRILRRQRVQAGLRTAGISIKERFNLSTSDQKEVQAFVSSFYAQDLRMFRNPSPRSSIPLER